MTLVTVPPPAQPLRWLGGPIDVRVEVDTGGGPGLETGLWDISLWGEALWGSVDPVWQDMTRYVIEVTIDRGAERWGQRFRVGTCSIVVDNTDGFFTPGVDVPNSPFFREFRPGRRIRVVALPDPADPDLKVPLFTGRLDASVDQFGEGAVAPVAVLHCLDPLAEFHASNPPEGTPTGVQLTSERVHAALDRIGWPEDLRDIQTGLHTIQSSTLANTTLEECQRAADAEGGAFFASADGKATFKARNWLTEDDRSVNIQGWIGYDEAPEGAQAAPVLDASGSWELARVVNDVGFARAGGVMQFAEDPASIQAYGRRSYRRTDFLNFSDGELASLAVRYLQSFREPRLRVDSVTISAVADPDNEDRNRLMWDTRFGDRLAVRIKTRRWDAEREVHVMGISHHITASDWQVTFRLDDAQTLPTTFWVLQDPNLGVLGETTRLA